MPRYFFNFKDGELLLDQDGVELAGLDAARTQAVVASGEMLKDRGGKFWDGAELAHVGDRRNRRHGVCTSIFRRVGSPAAASASLPKGPALSPASALWLHPARAAV